MIDDELLYFMSKPDDDPKLRLHIPDKLKCLEMAYCQEGNEHLCRNNVFRGIWLAVLVAIFV